MIFDRLTDSLIDGLVDYVFENWRAFRPVFHYSFRIGHGGGSAEGKWINYRIYELNLI